MYLLGCYVPESHLDSLKSALFAAGAGRIGDYDSCVFETRGRGQFRPLAGSDPFAGKTGAVEQVDEVKVELVLEESVREEVIAALRRAHPYEEPAYHLIRIET